MFNLEKLPKNLIVLGAGAIGVELSQAFSRIGVRVKLVEKADNTLYREDVDMANALKKILLDEGVDYLTSPIVLSVKMRLFFYITFLRVLSAQS